MRQTPKNVGAAIQKAMRAIESANPDLLDGIFGDAPWTNRERLADETLKNLIEHFSTQTLSVATVPEDELGNAYEYLIKKFADDSGHTAAEFYTNRTVVHLMTQLLSPKAGESIYDPTCGTGGMLISALDEVKRSGGEHRTLKLYGQERNLITSSIARMNLLLHGVLFRNEEQTMRARMIEQDWVEAVIGLGPNLFYNSPMESCIVVCNRGKPAARQGKVLFIDAVNEVTRERAQSFLKPEHQQRILTAYRAFADAPGFAKVASLAEIGANAGNLSIPLYVKRQSAPQAAAGDAPQTLREAWDQWQTDGRAFWQQMDALVETLDRLVD